MKNLLVISYFYPPQKGIGGKRIFRLLSRLPALGWAPTVLTTPWPPALDRDMSQPIFAEGITLERGYVPPWFWRRYHGEQGGEYQPGPLAKGLASLSRLFGYPIDGKLWLAPFAYCRAIELGREKPFDAVLSTSSPYSSHLVALSVAKRLGVPFFADLRDPWTFNFLWRDRPPLQKKLDHAAERLVFSSATKVFLAAEATRVRYQELYPQFSEKMLTIYSGFEEDPEGAPVLPWPEERPKVAVAHFGRFYGVRRMDKTLSSLAAASQSLGLGPKDLQLLVLGDVQPKDQEQIDALGLSSLLKVSPMMPYEEGLSLLRGADVLFLCDYDVEPYFVPGKLFDYLRVNRPIFALSANEELRQIIHQTRTGKALHPDDAEGQRRVWEEIVREGPRVALGFAPQSRSAQRGSGLASQTATSGDAERSEVDHRSALSADFAASRLARALS